MNRWMIVGVVCCSFALADNGVQVAPARFDGLLDYFQDANPAFFHHVRALVEQQAAGQLHTGMTCVAGISGVGKSYVIANLPFGEDTASKPIKLSRLFTESRPDLISRDGQVVFNRLPWSESFDLQQVLQDRQALETPFILLDDLDEIHPVTAMRVLESVQAYVQSCRQRFVHVLIFGRPESFRPWVVRYPQTPVQSIVGPDWQTTGDLAFCCHNYYGYKYSQSAPQKVIDTFQSHLEEYPFLRDTIRPLSGGNFVIQQSLTHKTKKQLQGVLFQDLLVRNAKSHGRPEGDDVIYRSLLQQAAAYAQQQGHYCDEQGFFTVSLDDVLPFHDEQGQVHYVGLMELLNRSGLVNVDLSQIHCARYRFEPSWLQEYLLGLDGTTKRN